MNALPKPTVTKMTAACPHRKSGACGECFGVLVGRDLRNAVRVGCLRRRVAALESRLARVLLVGANRENALRYDTGAPTKGNVWSGPRRGRGRG